VTVPKPRIAIAMLRSRLPKFRIGILPKILLFLGLFPRLPTFAIGNLAALVTLIQPNF
jgi:hypothetical protein